MKTSTRLIIGATVIAIGVGVIGLGFLDQESNIRQVNELLDDPAAHATGRWTLIGMPQPRVLTAPGPDGATIESANPAYNESVQHVIRWERDGRIHLSTITTTVHGPDQDGVSHWSLSNATRVPGSTDAPTVTHANWTISRPHMIFQIEGFMEAGDPPVIWGIYEGVLTSPLQPKPSQFEGRIARAAPGDIALPPEAIIYSVEEYTAGCSSKFLPPEVAEEYEDDPDIE